MAGQILPSGTQYLEIDGHLLKEVAPRAEPSDVGAFLALQEFQSSGRRDEAYHLAITRHGTLILTGPISSDWRPAPDSVGICLISGRSNHLQISRKLVAAGYS